MGDGAKVRTWANEPWQMVKLRQDLDAALAGRFTDDHPVNVAEALIHRAFVVLVASGMPGIRAARYIQAAGEERAVAGAHLTTDSTRC